MMLIIRTGYVFHSIAAYFVYQFHRLDPAVPFEDSVGEIAKMKAEGNIRHVGLSNVTIEELKRAQKIVPVVTIQNHYNLAQRQSTSPRR